MAVELTVRIGQSVVKVACSRFFGGTAYLVAWYIIKWVSSIARPG